MGMSYIVTITQTITTKYRVADAESPEDAYIKTQSGKAEELTDTYDNDTDWDAEPEE